jgi:hypothetical protein
MLKSVGGMKLHHLRDFELVTEERVDAHVAPLDVLRLRAGF